MSVERYFPKSSTPTYCGQDLYGYSCGYPIGSNPQGKFEGTIKSVVRMMNNPVISEEELEYCITKNAEALNIHPEDLLLLAEDRMDLESKNMENLDEE